MGLGKKEKKRYSIYCVHQNTENYKQSLSHFYHVLNICSLLNLNTAVLNFKDISNFKNTSYMKVQF